MKFLLYIFLLFTPFLVLLFLPTLAIQQIFLLDLQVAYLFLKCQKAPLSLETTLFSNLFFMQTGVGH